MEVLEWIIRDVHRVITENVHRSTLEDMSCIAL